MQTDFLALHNKKKCFFVTVSVHCSGKNIVLVELNSSWMLKKILKHFAEKSFSVFYGAPSDTLNFFLLAKLFISICQRP